MIDGSLEVYIAAPLFTAAEIAFNKQLADALTEKGVIIYLPQEMCAGEFIWDRIFKICKERIDQSDIVVAVLDGTSADDGTSWECGYAFAQGKPIIGVRTDFRMTGDSHGFNLMNRCGCWELVFDSKDYVQGIKKAIAAILSRQKKTLSEESILEVANYSATKACQLTNLKLRNKEVEISTEKLDKLFSKVQNLIQQELSEFFAD